MAEVNVLPINYRYGINLIYSVHETFQVIFIMHFNWTDPYFYSTIFLKPFPANKMQLFIHSTVPFLHPRLFISN